ncbi:MAG: hypothetical protein R3E98_18120 [Gemmatimonadota bacterium]
MSEPTRAHAPGRDYLPDHRQEAELRQPYEEGYFASTPTRLRRFFRTFVPWQLWRFAAINLRMLRMIGKSPH